MTQSVLIVDDDPIQRRLLDAQVARAGLRPVSCGGGRAALEALANGEAGQIGAIVLDLMMPDMSGIEVMAEMRRRGMDIPIIVQTAKGSVDTVVEAMRAGAFDFVVKPVSPEKLRAALDNALRMRAATRRRDQADTAVAAAAPSLDGSAASAALRPVLASAAKAAASNIPVLIEGETGVGKEWLARAIQAHGDRAKAGFVPVNCGAMPTDLVESILFGHAKGAFTDATARHEGKFIEADGGTLFLDEVGELSASAQVKLLRVLQDGEIDPVGSKTPTKTDVRIISATNRDLAAAVAAGRFREDLYYRLNAFELRVPPLRERRGEISALARGFVAHFVGLERGTRVRRLSEEAIAVLCRYDWPGNIRQLENTIHRAVVLSDNENLLAGDFPQIAALLDADPAGPAWSEDPGTDHREPPASEQMEKPWSGNERRRDVPAFPLRDANGQIRRMEDVEADLIRLAMAQYGGRMSEIARRLGIGRSTLYRKLRAYNIAVD
ncbi:sigma-54 dependent transcriptional regulator [Aurantimonas sp. C2-6-R+9]|uniref:sigma-54-dependent transcriptional regulator n=1 Tax=unclassified Aurantimonas TaxID=2638230 RepID=UPI002E1967C4|nr:MULTISPECIES: sigma-54 dependent transcriptional regulator [unclassified Aurantimonas]MEC5289319.1 sigma-54 dependent transcriptional regulator [Aurantimonas sp. C2-3-R2]MEC5380045.1 sigma-54 dependent transcriptional regulator [Aurantimonas sp. C2-6-R+9]MEC5410231.1 sigma-54 dependent transcriptional regulator [Aurantimonas sp. C2-4-R8]